MRVRLNNIDHTFAKPGDLDDSTLHKVPVIRIFGVSSTGLRACLHVHQVFPYFYIDYHGSLSPDRVRAYIHKLTKSLNHATAISLRRDPGSEKAQYIRAIILVKGIPFYGFHAAYQPYLKVLIADPTYVSRIVTILQSGGVMGTRFTTYENHLSYYLQFMCDFGLYGCGWVELGEEIYQRGKDNETAEDSNEDTAPPPTEILALPASPYFKTSHLPLELDVCSHQILNRLSVEARDLHSSLRIPAPPAPDEPLILSVRELWEDERKRRLAHGLNPTPEMPKILSESRRGHGGDWVDFDRLHDLVEEQCQKEEEEGKVYRERNKGWERWVMSTFESVEALWEKKWRRWRPGGELVEGQPAEEQLIVDWRMEEAAGEGAVAEVDVNMELLSSQDMEGEGRVADREEEEADSEEELELDPEAEEGPPPDLQASQENGVDKSDVFQTSGDSFSFPSSSSHSAPTQNGVVEETPKASHRRNQSAASTTTAPASQPNAASDLGSFLTTTSSKDNTPTTRLAPYTSESDLYADAPPKKRRKVGSEVAPTFSFSSEATFDSVVQEPSVSPASTTAYAYSFIPPTAASLLSTLESYGLPSKEYRDPIYLNSDDLPERPREYAGLVFDLTRGAGVDFLPDWDDVRGLGKGKAVGSDGMGKAVNDEDEPLEVEGWEYASLPPSRRILKEWLARQETVKEGVEEEKRRKKKTHIEGQTQTNIYGFKATLAPPAESTREKQTMTILALEVFAKTSTGKVPHPEEDELVAIFYSYQYDSTDELEPDGLPPYQTGIIVMESEHFDTHMMRRVGDIQIVSSELDLINATVDTVRALDPDILVGWEVQAASWGYLQARGKSFGMDVADLIGRAPGRQFGGSDEWGLRNTSTFKTIGRHILNVWRLMRVELNLNMYTFENVAFHLLHRRVPKYTPTTLSKWFNDNAPVQMVQVMKYYMNRTCMVLDMLDKSDIITKTAEFARVFGVDFFSVISRGSQFKVESFMFRIAKPECFVLISPTKTDVGKQNAAECMPLIMEPCSAFYKGPLVVLDFQSLYPSVMIAYNYCYSTCLGRIEIFKGKNKLGVLPHLDKPYGLLNTVKDYLTISPNGMIFVKPEVRRGLLGRMLTELLDTRVMVKQAMKSVRGDKGLTRVLDARQLGLKYIANVTYGYTSATFSGRMPAVEIADAIVQSGRETLEKAIELIGATKKWGARVVYGDTDSLFIYLQGKTKSQAFLIGNEIADTITEMNPAPIKLKFEKVYLPCVLMAKKRYVGFKYERPDDLEPVFDAKGIETVRRDGIPAQQKMVERCLKILFRSQNLSAIKEYCQSSWKQILEGTVSVQDFIFAKEVRLGTYSDKVAPPPGAALAGKRVIEDPNDEPQYGERIPYVITRGEPGTKLVDRAVSPEEVVYNSSKHIDSHYYISRVLIPPLERIFNLAGADVRSWYNQMLKGVSPDNSDTVSMSPSKAKVAEENPGSEDIMDALDEQAAIDSHYRSARCILCGAITDEVVCNECKRNPQESLHALLGRLQEGEQRLKKAHSVCVTCTLSPPAEKIRCESLDCPWFYARKKAEQNIEDLQGVHQLAAEIERLALYDKEQFGVSVGGEVRDRNASPVI